MALNGIIDGQTLTTFVFYVEFVTAASLSVCDQWGSIMEVGNKIFAACEALLPNQPSTRSGLLPANLHMLASWHLRLMPSTLNLTRPSRFSSGTVKEVGGPWPGNAIWGRKVVSAASTLAASMQC